MTDTLETITDAILAAAPSPDSHDGMACIPLDLLRRLRAVRDAANRAPFLPDIEGPATRGAQSYWR